MTACASTAVPGRSRRGMTLVELLIVVLLLAGFMALVVAGVRGSQAPQLRRVAEQLAAALTSAQSRSLGVPEGAGTIVTISGSTTVYDAVMQPHIEATVSSGVPPSDPSSASASVNFSLANADTVSRAYKILLTGTGGPGVGSMAWMAFAATGMTSGNASFRAGTGQTSDNTVWPKSVTGGSMYALLGQYPNEASAAVGLGDAVTIDTRFSGTGDGTQFAGKTWIAVVFDRVGRVGEVLTCDQDPDVNSTGFGAGLPASTIYLLVARKDDVDAGRNTLASDDTLWVAISPQTGRVLVADNVPQSGADVRAARQNARQGITAKR